MVDGHSPFPLTSAALEKLTYPSPNSEDFALDDNDLERTIPLDNGRHRLDPKADLGVLEGLPLEILTEILVQVDLDSLSTLRRVSQRAMQIIDTIPQYRAILQHCPTALRGILAIDIGSLVSCQKLFCALITATCADCGDFGGFIYLFTGTRVCFLCLSGNDKYLPFLASEVRHQLLSRNVAAGLPRMLSLPGRYSPTVGACRLRLTLYDYESTCRVAEVYHDSVSAMDRHIAGCVPRNGNGPILPRRIPHLTDRRTCDPKRFMAIVRAPWLNPLTRLPEWGFHCIACRQGHYPRAIDRRRKFSTLTFDKHFQECGELRKEAHSRWLSLQTDKA